MRTWKRVSLLLTMCLHHVMFIHVWWFIITIFRVPLTYAGTPHSLIPPVYPSTIYTHSISVSCFVSSIILFEWFLPGDLGSFPKHSQYSEWAHHDVILIQAIPIGSPHLLSPDAPPMFHIPFLLGWWHPVTIEPLAITSTWSMNSGLSEISQSSKQSTVAMPVHCSIIGSDDELDLFCWILNDSKALFSVAIGECWMVDHLKKVIKKDMEPDIGLLAPSHSGGWACFSWYVPIGISDIREAIPTHSFW